MILRRVIEHVKKQHWTAVFLDFVIVVLGVFIGIQVSNWNAERAQRVAAADFHARLLADMRLEEINYKIIQAYYLDAQHAAETAHKGLTGEVDLSDADLLINAFRGSQYNWMERHRSTFDELVASGNFDLIADTQLRTIVTGYFAATYLEDLSRDNRNSEYRIEFRKTISPGLHQSLNEQCGDKQIEGAPLGAMTLGYPCVLELPSENISDAVAALRSNENLLPALRLHIANLSSWNFTLETNYTAYQLGTFKQDGGAAQ